MILDFLIDAHLYRRVISQPVLIECLENLEERPMLIVVLKTEKISTTSYSFSLTLLMNY